METLIEFRLVANLPNSFCQNQSTRCRISAYSKKFECIKTAYEVTDIRLKAIHISKDIDATSIGKREVGRVGGWGAGEREWGGSLMLNQPHFFHHVSVIQPRYTMVAGLY